MNFMLIFIDLYIYMLIDIIYINKYNRCASIMKFYNFFNV